MLAPSRLCTITEVFLVNLKNHNIEKLVSLSKLMNKESTEHIQEPEPIRVYLIKGA